MFLRLVCRQNRVASRSQPFNRLPSSFPPAADQGTTNRAVQYREKLLARLHYLFAQRDRARREITDGAKQGVHVPANWRVTARGRP